MLNEQFVPLLARLDECISYIGAHMHFQDSRVYLARFAQLQSRALNLVKVPLLTHALLRKKRKHESGHLRGCGVLGVRH